MNFLRTSLNAVRGEEVPVREFAKLFREQSQLNADDASVDGQIFGRGIEKAVLPR